MKFTLGNVHATPGAARALEESGESPGSFLRRHLDCDWGEVPEEDNVANEASLKDGSRLLSAYKTSKGVRLWIITEAENDEGQRESTTILLPEEY